MKHVMKILAILLLMPAMLTACANRTSAPTPASQGTGYVLGSGDTLRIIVYGQEELSGEFKIDPSGRVALPLIKDVVAAGLTVPELQDKITSELEPKYLNDPKVSIEVLEYRNVYILGEVRTPGKYAYVPNMTVLQAVAVAGGHTYRADEDSAEVTRLDNDVLRTFNLRARDMVKPGDTLVIKRRWF